MELIKKQIYQLELELLKPDTRRSAEKIGRLLSEDFIEYCSSGNIYKYAYGDVFDSNTNSSETTYVLEEFEIKELTKDCVLATYKIIKSSEINENKIYSLRSSIWKSKDGEWRMIFHQGTIIPKF